MRANTNKATRAKSISARLHRDATRAVREKIETKAAAAGSAALSLPHVSLRDPRRKDRTTSSVTAFRVLVSL